MNDTKTPISECSEDQTPGFHFKKIILCLSNWRVSSCPRSYIIGPVICPVAKQPWPNCSLAEVCRHQSSDFALKDALATLEVR